MGIINYCISCRRKSNMQRVKAHELRSKDDTACVEELAKHRKELASLRVSKVAAAPQVKLAKVRAVRKNIAKVLTVLNEKARAKAKENDQIRTHKDHQKTTKEGGQFQAPQVRRQRMKCMTCLSQQRMREDELSSS